MTFPLERHTIFITLAGSQAHGTSREGSDVDLRGVCIAPLATRLSLFSTFEQYEGLLTPELEGLVRPRLAVHADKSECVIFDLAKFIGLCAQANPNALEILFADQGDWLFETAAWRRLHAERFRFLTRKVEQTFLGYALAQLRKIENHRSRLLHPPAQPPSGAQARQRNPTRAALEQQHGYDTKHAMHLVRLMRMGVEALERGDLLVRRPDATELNAIRDGRMSFAELSGLAARLQDDMERAALATSLPDDLDQDVVDALAFELLSCTS